LLGSTLRGWSAGLGAPIIADSFEELVTRGDVRLVVEAASQEAVRQYALRVLREGKDLMVMSTGALLDDELHHKILMEAEASGRRVYIPSGAIVGLDNVKSAALGGIDSATLTTRKPPRSFEGAPYITERSINLKSIKEPTTLCEGPAREAVKPFPRNVNVAASLSLAGIGADRTIVRVIADPTIDHIIHEIRVKGVSGELYSSPLSDSNPKKDKRKPHSRDIDWLDTSTLQTGRY